MNLHDLPCRSEGALYDAPDDHPLFVVAQEALADDFIADTDWLQDALGAVDCAEVLWKLVEAVAHAKTDRVADDATVRLAAGRLRIWIDSRAMDAVSEGDAYRLACAMAARED